MKKNPLLSLALALFVIIAIGWLLAIGRPIILPIITALITVYVMSAASNALRRLRVLRVLPPFFLRFILISVFATLVLAFAIFTTATVREIASRAPLYEENLDRLLEGVAVRFGLDRQAMWDELSAVTVDAFDLQDLVLFLLGGFTNIGATIFIIALYAAFFMSERATFESKISAAFKQADKAERVLDVVRHINSRVGEYLAIKTLINLVLAGASFLVLWAHGADFALFWALVIGLLNYIPYLGSYIGVFFPVILSLAQFASLPITLSLAAFLTIAQVLVGNILEPRLVGRQVNLSPVVVLVSLSVWMALWGVPGAILAVPMTSVLVIILAHFEDTEFLAILLSDKVDSPVTATKTRE